MTDGDPTDSYAAARARLLQIIRAPDDVDTRQVDTVLRGVHGRPGRRSRAGIAESSQRL